MKTGYQFSLPRHFVHPVIVVTDIVNDATVSFKSVNKHKNCIVLRDDNPLGCDFDYESYLRMACIGLVSCNHLSTLLINKKCVKRLKFDQNFHYYLVLAAILDSIFISQ